MTPIAKTGKQVHVFCTNVQNPEQKKQVLTLLQPHIQIEDVSLDLEDCDRVLRVVTDLEATEIISLLNTQGISCTELL